jgi:hypothetical protein
MSQKDLDRIRELVDLAKTEVLDSSDSNDLAVLAGQLLQEYELTISSLVSHAGEV